MPSSAWKSDVCRSEEHTSELQSLTNIVCRLLLEKRSELTRRRGRPVASVVELATSESMPVRPTPRNRHKRKCALRLRCHATDKECVAFFLMFGQHPAFPLFPYPPLSR